MTAPPCKKGSYSISSACDKKVYRIDVATCPSARMSRKETLRKAKRSEKPASAAAAAHERSNRGGPRQLYLSLKKSVPLRPGCQDHRLVVLPVSCAHASRRLRSGLYSRYRKR